MIKEEPLQKNIEIEPGVLMTTSRWSNKDEKSRWKATKGKINWEIDGWKEKGAIKEKEKIDRSFKKRSRLWIRIS